MEFVPVGPMKLKVILNNDDCLKYRINPDLPEPDGVSIRNALRELFALAAEKTSFRVGSEKVLVQLYPIPSGGCELFVTKLSAIGEREREAIKNSASLTTYQGRDAVFRFEDFVSLVRSAHSLRGTASVSDLYCGWDGAYYLSTAENLIGGISDVEALSEFGSRLSALPPGIDGEWGKCIVRGCAIAYLRRLNPD